MSDYTKLLNAAFSNLVKKYNKFQLSNHTKASLIEGSEIINEGAEVLNCIKSHLTTLESLVSDCKDFVNEIEEDLSQKPRAEDFVYQTKKGMLSYIGHDYIQKDKTPVIQKPKVSPRVFIDELKYNIKLSTVKNLKQLQPMFSYVQADPNYAPGFYACVIPGVYVRVPFPVVVEAGGDRDHSVRCKYRTKESCNLQRGKMAKYHNSQVRQCSFSHEGEKIIKIGYHTRCPAVPDFGNPATMASDVKSVGTDDIQSVLMYGITDLFSAAVYFDYYKVSKVFDRVDIA